MVALSVAALAAVFSVVTAGASPSRGLAELEAPGEISVDPSRTVLVFYSSTCPHCHNLMGWMRENRHRFPDVEIHNLEVVNSGDAPRREYFFEVMALYGTTPQGVPRTVIGDRVYIGFSPDSLEDRFLPEHRAWIGSRLALTRALTTLQNSLAAPPAR